MKTNDEYITFLLEEQVALCRRIEELEKEVAEFKRWMEFPFGEVGK